jgi:aromatic amino acid aminotransferase I / 2-aminoadipate transaminase
VNQKPLLGLPNPDYFPFASLEAKTLPIDYYSASPSAEAEATGLSWLWNLFSNSSAKHMGHIAIPKYVTDPTKDVNLATALQYGEWLHLT